MRHVLVLLATTTLAACGGAGPTSPGGSAAPSGPGGAVGSGSGSSSQSGHTFVAPTEPKTYSAIGGVQHYEYNVDDRDDIQVGQLYAGDATTARNSGISVTYNPRDATFDLRIAQPAGLVDQTIRYQDPLHRTAFGGAAQPQLGNPNLTANGVQYFQSGRSETTNVSQLNEAETFFFQKPGTSTQYVTYAGFVRNSALTERKTDAVGTAYFYDTYKFDRGAFVYGERSANSAIPTTGSGTFTGEMIATMVFNPLLDSDRTTPTYFQWIAGTSRTAVDFAANSFTIDLSGTVFRPLRDSRTSGVFTIQENAAFTAAGAGRVDLSNAGGLIGQMTSAFFVNPGGQRYDVNIGGSSVNGALFGPAAQEVGGGFRVVGGTPDERVDIVGAFTAKRP